MEGREKVSRKAQKTAGNIFGPHISQKYFGLISASQQETEKELELPPCSCTPLPVELQFTSMSVQIHMIYVV